MYQIPNLKLVNHKLPVAEYLKAGWLRSPLDLSFAFASEQAIDQLAYLLQHRSVRVPPAQHHRRALARRARCGGEGRELDAAAARPRSATARRSSPGAASGSARICSRGAAPSPTSK